MSLFGNETNRLIRTKWRPEQIDDFAQEVYALLSGNLPMTINAPVKIAPRDGSIPLTVTPGPDSTNPSIAVNNGGVTQTIGGNTDGDITIGGLTFNPPADGSPAPAGGGSGGGGGGIDLGGLDYTSSPPDPQAVPDPGQNPFILYGEVAAKATGSNYSVNVWAKDPGGYPKLTTLDVLFPGVDPDEEIEAGTPCPVICFPGRLAGSGRLGIVKAIGFVATFQ
jgi:hypothetical protein